MAITFTKSKFGPDVWGRRRLVPCDLTFDTSYPAGGYSITPSQLGGGGGRDIEGASYVGGNAASRRFSYLWDTTNEKLRLFRPADAGGESYSPGGGDIKGATNQAGTEGNADQNAAPVNSGLLLAAATFTSLAGTMTPTTQPDVPRNIVITVTNDSGGALDLFEGTTTFLITGTDKFGVAQTESVTLVSTSGNKSVANSKFRFIQSSKAFRTVTSVAITNAPAGTLKGSLGVGTRLGLPSDLPTPLHTDVLSLTINAARQATSATVTSAGGVDTTYFTVNVGTIADGADVGIVYLGNGEVTTGTDLSAVTARINFQTI